MNEEESYKEIRKDVKTYLKGRRVTNYTQILRDKPKLNDYEIIAHRAGIGIEQISSEVIEGTI